MSKKLWEWGGQNRNPSVCAINAQSGKSLQIAPPPPSPYNTGNGNSRIFPENPTTEQSLHQCKLHMSKNLWEWGGQKRKPSVCAINEQSGTSLQVVPPPPSPYIAGNGNSHKFRAKHYTRTILALMQTTYEQEAVGMGRPKSQSLRLCNQRTKRFELANCSASTIAV